MDNDKNSIYSSAVLMFVIAAVLAADSSRISKGLTRANLL